MTMRMEMWLPRSGRSTVTFLILIICVLFSASSTSSQTPSTPKGSLVLLVSFDGFRWDYLDRTATQNFDALTAVGVKAKYVFDVFVSKTFPNHYTIVTGLYEESHGLVGNEMYDPYWNESFDLSKQAESKWWQEGEPIWVTNQKQGGKSAVIMYPGSYDKIHNMFPTYHLEKYNSSFPFDERIDIVMEYFASSSINLGVLYFHEPDHAGHEYGPESPEMDSVIQMCDHTLGYLLEKIRAVGLEDQINIIITSDHGMTEVSSKNYTQLDEFVEPSLYHYTNNNPVIGIWPYQENNTDLIYSKLRDASPKMKVYLKDEIPEEYHYNDNRRISPILLVAVKGWSIYRGNESISTHKGGHGYNNSLMDMHPIFVARGPLFQQGLIVEPFDNVNIYPLMCNLLGIQPRPNNGSLDKVKDLLRPVHSTTQPATSEDSSTVRPTPSVDFSAPGLTTGTIVGISVAGGIGLIAGCLVLAMCMKQRSYRQPPTHYTPIADTSLDAVDEGGFQPYNYPNTTI